VNDLSTAAPSVPPLVDQMIADRLEGVAPRRSSLPCRSKSSQPVEAVEHRDACLDQSPDYRRRDLAGFLALLLVFTWKECEPKSKRFIFHRRGIRRAFARNVVPRFLVFK